MKRRAQQTGFTIVELLIVIVVIGILAAITIVAYNGIQKRAEFSSVASFVANAKKKIELFKVDNDTYPGSVTDCPNPVAVNLCLTAPSGTSILYNLKTNATPVSYEIAALGPSQFYYESSAEISSYNEFVQYTDMAPFIDKYGLVAYQIEFDGKTASSASGRGISIYMQNGSGMKYAFGDFFVPTTSFTRQNFVLTPTLSNPTLTQSILAFYGEYNTGNRPIIKNLKMKLR